MNKTPDRLAELEELILQFYLAKGYKLEEDQGDVMGRIKV